MLLPQDSIRSPAWFLAAVLVSVSSAFISRVARAQPSGAPLPDPPADAPVETPAEAPGDVPAEAPGDVPAEAPGDAAADPPVDVDAPADAPASARGGWDEVIVTASLETHVVGEAARVLVVPAGEHPELGGASMAVRDALKGHTRVQDARRAAPVKHAEVAEIVSLGANRGFDHIVIVRMLDVDGRTRAVIVTYDASGNPRAELGVWKPEDARGGQAPLTAAAPAPSAAAVASDLPPRAGSYESEAPANASLSETQPDDFDRKGFMLAISAGLESCAQPLCGLITIGGIGRLELGYRHKWVAAVVSTSIGGAPVDVPAESTSLPAGAPSDVKAALRFFDIGAGLQVFPVGRGRVDPFVHFGLGYSRISFVVSEDDEEYDLWFSRPAVQLGTGLSIHVSRHVALGPRFDAVLPFGGKLCETIDGAPVEEDECDTISEIVSEAETPIDERTTRKLHPKPWSVTLDLHVVF